MSLIGETEGVPRRTMTLFFLVDTSGSMIGDKIDAVNDAISNVLPMIDDISKTNPDAEIKVAALEFASNVNWIYDEPKSTGDFTWMDVQAGGGTALGVACEELKRKLSRSGFMQSASGSYAPAIILLSDGVPTDDYTLGLSQLKSNNWFKNGIKIAIAIGDDADQDALADFTGSSEAVFTVHNVDALKYLIRLVAVTSSKVASNSASANSSSKQSTVVSTINENLSTVNELPTWENEDW